MVRRPSDRAGIGGVFAADLVGARLLVLPLPFCTSLIILTKKADGFRTEGLRRRFILLAACSC